LLPLGGAQGTEAALVWSATPEVLDTLTACTPGDFVARLNTICMPAATATSLTQAPQTWPLEFAQASQWIAPGMALAGDAAHAMHPLAGQGLNVGLADVATLAQVLQEREYWRELGDPRLLRRYERSRKAAFVRMGGLTDGLFHVFHQELPALRTLRNWGMNGLNQLPSAKRWLTRQAMA
jgi:2-polyprenyl-6-methoxyphenol hydroxylase-like FAD-dependent oxidoreductase